MTPAELAALLLENALWREAVERAKQQEAQRTREKFRNDRDPDE